MASRVHHVIDYGADPTGTSDSTEALERAIQDAFQSPLDDAHLMEGVADLGGSELHLDGGTYKISRPLLLPNSGGGNFMVLPLFPAPKYFNLDVIINFIVFFLEK